MGHEFSLGERKACTCTDVDKLKLDEAEKAYNDRVKNGYYAAGEEALHSLPEDFNLWNATPEQEALYKIWEDRGHEESADRMTVTFLRNMNAAANTPR